MEPNDHPSNDEPSVPAQVVVDYDRPEPPNYFSWQPLGIMIGTSLGWLLIVEFFYGMALDCGVTASRVTTTWLAYVFVAAIILIRRVRKMTKIDLAFVGFGYPLFVLITEPFVR